MIKVGGIQMRSLKMGICSLLVGLSVFCGMTCYADGGVKSQDGKEKSEIYVDSGAPSSFKNAKYYDTAIPYNLTYGEVGGYAIEGTVPNPPYQGLLVMPDNVVSAKIGGIVQQMGASDGFTIPNRYGNKFDNSKVTYGIDSDTGARIVTDSHGVSYYLFAIQGIHFNAADSFFPFTSEFLGQAVDIILTDGTVIHMCAAEANSNSHTNGTIDGSSTTTVDGTLVINDLKIEQYRNLFQACNGGQIEMISKGANKFSKKYNIGTGEGQNRIMYYRMYNFKVDNAPEPADESVVGLDYKLSVEGALNADDNGGADTVSFDQTGLFTETHYVKWKSTNEWNAYFNSLDDLEKSEIYDIENWKADLEKDSEESILIKGGRWLAILFGILFEVWMLLIYLSYWFDRINNFIDISLLEKVTFGKLMISPDESECTFKLTKLASGEKRTINHKNLIEIVIIGLGFGALIISGVLFKWLNMLITQVLRWLN